MNGEKQSKWARVRRVATQFVTRVTQAVLAGAIINWLDL